MLDDVEVTARRGSTKIRPEQEYDADQIDAQGAYDIGEVMRRATQTFSPGEEPVVIVNGVRLPNPSIYYGLPADALERLEVLPAGSAAAFGGSPSARVLNLVTQRRFKSRDGQLTASAPTLGGFVQGQVNLRQSRLEDSNLSNFTFSTAGASSLRADDRSGYLAGRPGSEGVTLTPATTLLSANAAFNRGVGDWTASLNLNAATNSSRSTSRSFGELADLRSLTDRVRVESGLGGTVRDWSVRLNLNAQADETYADGLTSSVTQGRRLGGSIGLDRQLPGLPAGPITANLTANLNRTITEVEVQNETRRFSSVASDWTGQVSIPLTPRRDAADIQPGFGSAVLTLGGGSSQGEAGGGAAFSMGLGLEPLNAVRLNAAWRRDISAPSNIDRFSPIRLGPSMIVYDFRTSEAVEVQTLLGGNPNLRASTVDVSNLNLSAGPFTPWQISIGTDLSRVQARDGVASSLQPTPENETAYPERFVRNDAGRLVQIDQRPLTTSSSDAVRLSTNLSLLPSSGSFDGRQASLALTLVHNLVLQDRADFGAALPALDRLAGDGGGASRQTLSLSVTRQRGPWGIQLSGRWEEGYRSRRMSGEDGDDDLIIESSKAADIKLSYMFLGVMPGQASGAASRRGPGARIELTVLNLSDSRQSARLADGRPAPGYGRDERDPIGRRIQLSLSKRF